MKKLFFIVFFLLSFYGYSQEDAWVYFNDKPNAATQLNTPLDFLTQRALDRRTNQGIALTGLLISVICFSCQSGKEKLKDQIGGLEKEISSTNKSLADKNKADKIIELYKNYSDAYENDTVSADYLFNDV